MARKKSFRSQVAFQRLRLIMKVYGFSSVSKLLDSDVWIRIVGIGDESTISNWRKDGVPDHQLSNIAKCFNLPIHLFTDNRILNDNFIKAAEIRKTDPLADISFADVPTTNTSQPVKMYNCGHRLKEIRSDIRIKRSEMIELLDLPSEKQLHQIELQNLEVSATIINWFVQQTGAEEEWIKHGKSEKYRLQRFPNDDELIIDLLKRLNPESLYCCLEPSEMRLLFLVQLKKYHWRKYKFYHNLNFAEWCHGDYHYIPKAYKQLDAIFKTFEYKVKGRIISRELYQKLYSGRYHPIIIKDSPNYGDYWLDDYLDIENEKNKNFGAAYGEWFVESQDKIKLFFQ